MIQGLVASHIWYLTATTISEVLGRGSRGTPPGWADERTALTSGHKAATSKKVVPCRRSALSRLRGYVFDSRVSIA